MARIRAILPAAASLSYSEDLLDTAKYILATHSALAGEIFD